jgi:hypothetical protein
MKVCNVCNRHNHLICGLIAPPFFALHARALQLQLQAGLRRPPVRFHGRLVHRASLTAPHGRRELRRCARAEHADSARAKRKRHELQFMSSNARATSPLTPPRVATWPG